MMKIDINCDVGEGVGNENGLMPYIQSCNIACGGHAGNEDLMKYVIDLAIVNKVKIGAHPSYPDKENFGRKSLKMSSIDLINSIRNQISDLNNIIVEKGGSLNHIKPHGALYNDIAKNNELSMFFLEAIKSYKNKAKLYVPFNSCIEKMALDKGFSIIYEAFGDRSYNDDLSLVSRNLENAVLSNYEEVIEQVTQIFNKQEVKTITGKTTKIKAETFCIHSDTENAKIIVKNIYKHFNN